MVGYWVAYMQQIQLRQVEEYSKVHGEDALRRLWRTDSGLFASCPGCDAKHASAS